MQACGSVCAFKPPGRSIRDYVATVDLKRLKERIGH